MALVTKILEATLTAGQTQVTFTDSDIPNSLIRVFSSNTDVIPLNRTLIGNTLTVTYEAQVANMGVALEIQKQGLEIVDDLTSSDADNALSAKQGKALKTLIDEKTFSLSELDDVEITDIEDDQILAYDELSEKFVNINPASSSINYSTDETEIGTWINGSKLYQKTYSFGALPNNTQKTLSTGFTTSEIKIVDITGISINPETYATFTLPRAWVSASNTRNLIDVICNVADDYYNIRITDAVDYSSYTETYITLRYIKLS